MTSAVTTEELWRRCGRCGAIVYARRHERVLRVCPECDDHSPLDAAGRTRQLLDADSGRRLPGRGRAVDPLGFVDTMPYVDRLRQARARTGADEAVRCTRGTVDGRPVVMAAMDFRFLGGSLGSATGELITRAAEEALRSATPLLLVTASGGARMQEGALSLMQMAKTSQAIAELDEAALLTVSLITEPTFGGVAASFATGTDVVLAEPGARLGFAGPRVIEQTIGQRLPKGFQTAESLLGRGLVDAVVPRRGLRATLSRLLAVAHRGPVAATAPAPDPVLRDPERLPSRDAWETVRLARHPGRPTTGEYAHLLLDGFQELRGDRAGTDCPAIVGGLGRLRGVPVMLIGHQKGHTTKELVEHQFGMASPAGYRKVARLLRLAEKLRLPVVTLIDTPGAHPGLDAEAHGQAIAIAENLKLLSGLAVPVVAVVTGEGGSGGALALGVANEVLAFGNAFYSVISPEGCASILWKSPAAAREAAAALRLDARELLRLGVLDGVIAEPSGGAHADPTGAADLLAAAVSAALARLAGRSPQELVRMRRERFRRFGADACHIVEEAGRG